MGLSFSAFIYLGDENGWLSASARRPTRLPSPRPIRRNLNGGAGATIKYRTGNLIEKSLSMDNDAVSHERRLKHPAVLAVCEAAREKLFG